MKGQSLSICIILDKYQYGDSWSRWAQSMACGTLTYTPTQLSSSSSHSLSSSWVKQLSSDKSTNGTSQSSREKVTSSKWSSASMFLSSGCIVSMAFSQNRRIKTMTKTRLLSSWNGTLCMFVYSGYWVSYLNGRILGSLWRKKRLLVENFWVTDVY